MPVYTFECSGGHRWQEFRHVAGRDDPCPCPVCEESGVRQIPRVQHIPDISHTEGRTGDPVYIPAFGEHVSSRSRLRDLQRDAREKHFERTEGEHSVVRPFKDPDTGKVVHEKVTVKSEGVDMGEVHTMDSLPVSDEPKSPFDETGKMTVDEHLKQLEKKLGPEK